MVRLRRGGSASVAREPFTSSFAAGRSRFGAVGSLSLGGAVLALALLVGLTLTGASAQAAFPGTNGKIACHGPGDRTLANPDAEDDFEIFTINPAGGARTLVTNNGPFFTPGDPTSPKVNEFGPAFSPDGRKVAFESTRTGGSELFIQNADGTGPATRLTTAPADDAAPHFSPDGRQIVFTAGRHGGQFEVYKINADGSGETRLTTNLLNDGRASWSPDGTKIAFETTRPNTPAEENPNGEIATMNPDGTGVTLLTDTARPVSHRSTRWSPDGSQIVFESNRAQTSPSNTDIYKMNRNGSGVRRLTTNAGTTGLAGTATDQLPQFSPDGTKIIFDSGRDRAPAPAPSNLEVYMMNATDGSGETRVTNSPGTDSRCDWESIPRAATVYPPIYTTPRGTPPPGGKHRTSLTLRAKPRRDRRPPFRFTFSGRVRIPGGVSAAAVCGGRVRLVLKRGRRTVARGTARVSRRCTYRKRITFRASKRTGRKRARLRVTARFGGNASLSSASRRRTSVRIF